MQIPMQDNHNISKTPGMVHCTGRSFRAKFSKSVSNYTKDELKATVIPSMSITSKYMVSY